MSPVFTIARETHGQVEILRPHGDIDLSVSAELRTTLLDALSRGRDVLVDMAGVNYIDSSGVAGLVEGLQKARKQGRRFALAQLPDTALRVLQIARLDRVFPLLDDADPHFGEAG